jgi:threonylcarbamoyladenosine tRNA methylthiotransferase MtaB
VKRVSLYTLGCKLNQLETESIAASFGRAGFEIIPWENASDAHLLVINTCTVTSKAEQKARRVIRLALRQSSAPIIVTGCYAQLEAAKLAALDAGPDAKLLAPRRLFIVPGTEKTDILDLPVFLAERACVFAEDAAALLEEWLNTKTAGKLSTPETPAPKSLANGRIYRAFSFNPEAFSFHSRAFVKIQDGCDRNCAYCRVPLARGKSQSLDSLELLRRIKALEDGGWAELVLTAVDITQYQCPSTGKNLGELLLFLLEQTRSAAIRLSSLEPGPVLFTPSFLEAVSHRRIRPHFHLSVQSGSGAVLRAMNRSYGPETVRESVAMLRSVKNDPFLGCDMIAGFPGETEADFEQSYGLANDIGFAQIHAFPYSPRPGTPAWQSGNRAGHKETSGRLERLLELSRLGRKTYVERWTGRVVEGICEHGDGKIIYDARNSSPITVRTGNYLRVRAAVPENFIPVRGSAVHCRIVRPPDECQKTTGNIFFDADGELVVY